MQEQPAKRPERLHFALWALRLSQVFYLAMLLCTPLALFLAEGEARVWIFLWTACCMGGLAIACAIGLEVVIRGLQQEQYWGWIAGLCIAGLYIPSLFLPLGIMILVGLLDQQTQVFFHARK